MANNIRHNFNYFIDYFTNKLFDIRYCVETEKQVLPYDFAVSNLNIKHSKKYQASHVRLLNQIFNHLNIEYSQYSFVDIGAGKGRAMMLASRRGFKQVVGIEFAENLVEICQRNLTRFKGSYSNFELLDCDALEFTPLPNKTIYFMFNPFNKIMMQKLIDGVLLKSSTLRDDIVISLNPRCEFLMFLAGYEKIDQLSDSNRNREVHFYRYSRD